MLIEGNDDHLLAVSAADPRYAKHTVKLNDGRELDVTEDIQRTPEYKRLMWMAGSPTPSGIPSGPRFYVTNVTLPSGESVEPREALLPSVFQSNDGTVIDNYVCYAPSDS